MEENTFLNKLIGFIGPTNPSYLPLMMLGAIISGSGAFIEFPSRHKLVVAFIGILISIFGCYGFNKVIAQIMVIGSISMMLLYLVMT